jgi:hypothetical protein
VLRTAVLVGVVTVLMLAVVAPAEGPVDAQRRRTFNL